MPPARAPLDPHEEFGLVDEDEHEHHSLIELSGGRPRPRNAPSSGHAGGATSRSGGLCKSRVSGLLFVLALAGVYYLGLNEGKSEVKKESVDSKGGTLSEAGRVFPPKAEHGLPEESPKEPKVSVPMEAPAEPESPQPTDKPTKPPRKEGFFTRERLQATRAESIKIIELLESYYSSKEQAVNMLMNSWIDPWMFEGWNDDYPEDALKMDRSMKLVDTMARALVSDDQKTFLMGAIGSSVAAGHDNCHYDNYESQMERLFSPVWEAAGMEFVFQNAGEGGGCGDSYENQVFCINQNVSPNVDIVHYEWTYFEHGAAAEYHEMLIRWTQMMPRQPPVHVFNTGEYKKGSDNEVVSHYAKYGFNAFYMKTGFEKGGHDYKAESTRETDPIDRFSWGYVGDGYHDTTRYGELEADPNRKESLGVTFRNWHPGPMGFQLTSDAFTYVYTKAILNALQVIEGVMDQGHDPRDLWSEDTRPFLLKGDLPDPLFCDPEYCVVDEAPGCLNYELPTFGNWGARVEDPLDDLNPYLGEVQKWSVWHQNNDLWYMVGKQDTSVFKPRDDQEMCRHLDACGGISAQKADDGMVVFRLPKMEVGLVVICGCCGKKVGEEYFMNNANIEISYNTVVLDPATFEVWPTGKCVRLLKRFPTHGRESETPTGHAYLAIKILNDLKQPIRISHVITV